MTRRTHPRSSESGFALLLIFVLAAGIAIAMMTQLPRVCFETQRDREEMLIERGEQYKRAIGLYVKKWNKYPAKIEDLENTNNIRYLRRRYIDPMTGKKEWRLVHAGPGGMLTDSLVQKGPVGPDGKPLPAGANGMPGSIGMNNASMGSASGMNADPGNTTSSTTDPNQPPEVNQAVKARPSDRMMGLPGMASQPGFNPGQPSQNAYGYPPPAPGAYQQQYSQTGQPVYPGQPGYPAQPGYQQVPGQAANTGQPAYPPGTPGYQQPSGYPQQSYPGQPTYPQQQNPMQTPFAQPGVPGYPGQPVQMPGQPGYPQPGMSPPVAPPGFNQNQSGFAQNQGFNQQASGFGNPGGGFNNSGQATPSPAAQMIQQMLTQPRQAPPGMGGMGANTAALGAGIAGVATTYKSPSIKVYDERQKYQEWEFVYDPRKEAAKNMGAGGPPGVNPGNSPSQSGMSGFGQSNTQSGFGQSNQQSGFGQSGQQSGFGQSGQQSGFGQQSPQSGFGQQSPQSGFGRRD